MAITARRLNRATLARQLLLRRERLRVVEAVGRIAALQAQEPASPYLALWNRIEDFEPSALDRALAEREIVKGHLMRVTVHIVAAADYPALHEAMQTTLRAARLNDRRFTRTGLTAADADALIPELLAFAASGVRTGDALESWVDERVGELPKPSVWWALRHYAPLVRAVTGPPWSFGVKASYHAAVTTPWAGTRASAVAELVRRYLEAFGPATARDVATFGLINAPLVKAGLEQLQADGAVVRLEGPGTASLFDVLDGPLPDEDSPAPPRLLGMWDNVLLAYADRGRVTPPAYRKHIARSNGDVLPTILVDGQVAGVWRAVEAGIEATAFHRLPKDAWDGLAAEAASLKRFLADRDPLVYRRYWRWWKDLPAAEVRVL
jgi:winged helix DNA-binding protein